VEEGGADADGDWQDRIEGGLAAFLGYVAEQPTLARMCMIEALSATPETTKRYEDALEIFVKLTRQAVPSDEPGVYSFKTDLSMAGRWLLSIAAKVQGEAETVVGKITFRATR